MGRRNRLRYHCRKCIATACCQRTERCLIRHVFSHHYSSARKSKIVAALVAISFALSFVCNYLPGVSSLSEGTRTILLTVIISGAAAILFPVKQDAEEAAPAKANDSVQKGDNVNE